VAIFAGIWYRAGWRDLAGGAVDLVGSLERFILLLSTYEQ
jgi:hypothetical protein